VRRTGCDVMEKAKEMLMFSDFRYACVSSLMIRIIIVELWIK
jgi:hypothetical protein